MEQFKEKREKNRKSFFNSKKSVAKQTNICTSSSSKTIAKNVVVTVGLAHRDEHGNLRDIRGKRMPIQVKETANCIELQTAAVEKHSDHNQEFCSLESYCLLYSDFKEIIFIPGTTQLFDLKAYKTRLGKPYSQIVFYLCTETDLNDKQSHYDSLEDINNNAFDAHSEEERQDYLEVSNKCSSYRVTEILLLLFVSLLLYPLSETFLILALN